MDNIYSLYSTNNDALLDPDASVDPDDPVVKGKKLSEYTIDDFDQSYSLIVPEEPNEEYLVLESELDFEFYSGHSKNVLVMPKNLGDKAKILAVKDPRAVYTIKMNHGSAQVLIRPEDVYDGHTVKKIAYLSSTHSLGNSNITLRNILSGDISTINNNELVDPVQVLIDNAGTDLYKIVDGEYVFLDGSPISYGREHDNWTDLDDPTKVYHIAPPYSDIPMGKLFNKNIIVLDSYTNKKVFKFPDLPNIFTKEVRDNWGNVYLIRPQDFYTSGESKSIQAINKLILGETSLSSLKPTDLFYGSYLTSIENSLVHE